MLLSYIDEQLKKYGENKSFFEMISEPAEIKKLRKFSAEVHQSQLAAPPPAPIDSYGSSYIEILESREGLNQSQLFHLCSILLKEKTALTKSSAITFESLIKALESHYNGSLIHWGWKVNAVNKNIDGFAFINMLQQLQSAGLCNESNFLKLCKNAYKSRPLSKIWSLLAPALRTEQNFEILYSHASGFEELIQPDLSTSAAIVIDEDRFNALYRQAMRDEYAAVLANYSAYHGRSRSEALAIGHQLLNELPESYHNHNAINILKASSPDEIILVTQVLNLFPSPQHTIENLQNLLKHTQIEGMYAVCLNLPEALRTQANFAILSQPLTLKPRKYYDYSWRGPDNTNKINALINVFNILPKNLQTQDNFNAVIHNEKIFGHVLRIATIEESLRLIPKQVWTQTYFEDLMRLAENHLSNLSSLVNKTIAIEGSYFSLPEIMQTNNNLETLKMLHAKQKSNRYHSEAYITGTLFKALSAPLRTQTNFDTICQNVNYLKDSNSTIIFNFSRVPPHLFTQNLFDQIIQICIQDEGDPENTIEAQITALITRTIQQPGNNIRINGAQSTHTASVHATVSAAAEKLKLRYGDQINSSKKLDEVIAKIEEWSNTLEVKQTVEPKLSDEEVFQREKAKAAILFLKSPIYAYTDQKSQISTRQLLALVWLGLNDGSNPEFETKDEKHAKYTFKDIEKKFIIALYDIQRGYNMDDNYVDDNAAQDIRICTGGTFNKIAEILWGSHPDVRLIFLNNEIVNERMQAMYPEEIQMYWNEKYNNITTVSEQEDFFASLKNMSELDENSKPIWWESVREHMITKLMNEFGPSEKWKSLGVEPFYKSREDKILIVLVDSLSDLYDMDDYKFELKFSKDGTLISEPPASVIQPPSESTSQSVSSPRLYSLFHVPSTTNDLAELKEALEHQRALFTEVDPSLAKTLSEISDLIDKNPPLTRIVENLSRTIGSIRVKSQIDGSMIQDNYKECLQLFSSVLEKIEQLPQDNCSINTDYKK